MTDLASSQATSKSFSKDLMASVVVFLVALPLCMGVAIASGVPEDKAASVGIITGIVGGVLVGALAGSPLQVSGPAAGLSVIVAQLSRIHGWESVGLIVLLAGAIQLLGGAFKLGQWFRAVSPAVIHGMLAGIGVLILASQFQIMLDRKPLETGLLNLLALPESLVSGLVPNPDSHADDAARIGFLTIAILVLWKPCTPKSWHVIPPALVAVIFATGVSDFLHDGINEVMVPASLTQAITWPTAGLPIDIAGWKDAIIAAASLALIASAETLLCASAVDAMHSGPRTKYDKELIAQGIGNMVCGLVGALPITGVIVRSSANVEAGAKTRLSAILHGAWLLLCVVAIPFALRDIPRASLAGILVYTGFKLINPKMIQSLYRLGRDVFAIYVITLSLIVCVDLLTGVVAGIVATAIKLLLKLSNIEVAVEDGLCASEKVLHLSGAATFVSLPMLAHAIESIPMNVEVHVNLEKLDFIDHACFELLTTWERQRSATGGRLDIDWDCLRSRYHGAQSQTAS